MKKSFILILIFMFFSFSSYAIEVTKEECLAKEENFIFVSGECIEYRSFEGDENNHIIIIVHGTWDEGSNTLGRYEPFAETMNLNTDLTTIALALPGYSNSSENSFKSLASKEIKNQAATKDYALFVASLIKAFKKQFEAKTVTYIGHSAGARIGATITGLKPKLIQNIALVGGRYELRVENKNKGFIAFADLIDSVNKDINYLFVYGSEDKISKPEITTEFFKKAQEKGLKAKLVKVEGAGHIDLDMTDQAIEAIVEMLEQ